MALNRVSRFVENVKPLLCNDFGLGNSPADIPAGGWPDADETPRPLFSRTKCTCIVAVSDSLTASSLRIFSKSLLYHTIRFFHESRKAI